jgi:hypothetical protein
MIDIDSALAALAVRRPIFHSEADFQHALSWQLQIDHPDAALRIETRPERGIHLDILVVHEGRRTAIELKYLPDRFAGTVMGEHFDIPRRSAHDISRYDFCKDIWRLETMIAGGYADSGIAIALSNDGGYWRPGSKSDPIDAMFRIHNGRTVNGTLTWSDRAGVGTTKARTAPLPVGGNYACNWHLYGNGKPVEFRYLAIHVD